MRIACFALFCLLLFAGCGDERQLSYSFHKAQVSQDQLLYDEAALRQTDGVSRVIATRHQDGSATIEVAVDDENHILIQKKLTAMGYVTGQH